MSDGILTIFSCGSFEIKVTCIERVRSVKENIQTLWATVYLTAQLYQSWRSLDWSWKIEGPSRPCRHSLETRLETHLANRLKSIATSPRQVLGSWRWVLRLLTTFAKLVLAGIKIFKTEPRLLRRLSRRLTRTSIKFQSPSVVEVVKVKSWQWKVGFKLNEPVN